MDVSAHVMGEPNGNAVLWVAIAITAFDPGVDAPREVDNDVTLTLRSQRPMTLQDPGVGARDRVGVFEAFINDAVDHDFSAECAKILRDIVCRKLHEVLCHSIQGYPLALVENMIVSLQRAGRVVRVKPCQTVLSYCMIRQPCSGRRPVTKRIGIYLAREGLEDAESTWEQVSDVFPSANRRTAK